MDYPQIVTTIMEGLAPISSVVDAPWVTVTSINGMTGDVVVEPIIKPFESNHYYLKDSIITYNGSICIAKQTFTSGESFNSDDWNIPDFSQEQADWNEDDSTAKSYIKNKPTIPSVNNGILTIQSNGTNIASFSANSATNTTANILVPTETSVLINNGSDGTSVYVEEDELASVAKSGDYNDLSNLPTSPTVNNGALTIQQNGTTLDTFTANSSDDKTVNIQTITAETVAPAEEVGAITTNMIANGAVTASKVDWTTFKLPIPDYSNGTTIPNTTNTWTATKPGIVSATLVADTTNGYKNATISVNSKVVAKSMWAGVTGGYNFQINAAVPVGTGDVVTFSATDGQSTVSGRVFYPYKWV